MFVPDLPPPAPLAGNPYPIYDYDPRNHCPPPPSTAPLSGDPRSYGIYADHWPPPRPPSPAPLAGDPRSYRIYDARAHYWPPPPSTAPLLVGDPRFTPSLTPTPSPIPTPTGLSAWQLPVHGRASSSVDFSSAPVLTSPLNLWANPASSTSHRRRPVSPQLRSRFRAAASSAPYSSPHRDQYRDHRHHAGDESGRSSHRFRSPHRASRPLQPSPKRPRQLEHASKGPSPSPNKSQGSSSRGCRRMYDCEDERVVGRDQYLAERRTAELSLASNRLSPSPFDHCKRPPDSPVKLDASYEVNVMNSNGNLDPSSYESLVNDFMDAVERNWHETYDSDDDPAECEKKYREQIIRFSELALKRYNKSKNNKVKYSLVEAVGGNTIFEDTEIYVHVNFFAMAKNGPQKNGPKVLVFAELHHVGDRPNAMALTSFHLLDEKKQLSGHRHLAQDLFSSKDKDMRHCYACTDAIKHPDGARYKAGHFIARLYYYAD